MEECNISDIRERQEGVDPFYLHDEALNTASAFRPPYLRQENYSVVPNLLDEIYASFLKTYELARNAGKKMFSEFKEGVENLETLIR